MKRVFFWIMILSMVFSTVYSGVAEEEDFTELFLREPEYNHQFVELDQVIFDLEDQLGYNANFDINYSDQVVTIWLYQTELQIPCLIDRLSRRVLLHDFYLDERIVQANELYSMFDDREYSIYELDDDNYKICDATDDDHRCKIVIYSEADKKDFSIFAWEFGYEDGNYYVGMDTFRQLWYDVHKQDHVQDFAPYYQ